MGEGVMLDYWFESMILGSILVVGLAVFVALCVGLRYGECVQVSSNMKVPYKYVFPGGCMIEAKPGEWVQLKAFRVEK
jgi:hypothetical protein